MDEVQTVVVGAGVVGMAVARKLARLGHEVLVLEAEEKIAQHTSSRNSQVIHAGIYYEPGSWRAQLCVAGKKMLYDYCADRHVPHENTGKLIVAAGADHLARMPALMERAAANGVDDLVQITAADARAMEPELACHGAIWSPSTGIVDAPALVLSLQGEAEAEGAMVALGAALRRVDVRPDGFELWVGDGEQTRLRCRQLINAAGLGAWDVARGMDGFAPDLIPEQHYGRGSWYTVTGPAPFGRLIYPVPDDDTLGVHYVRDTGGGFRFGPDLSYLDPPRVDYRAGEDRGQAFEDSVRRWWPGVPQGAMQPDGVGIRPRIRRGGAELPDFQIAGPEAHGIAGLVQLFGIESPGLTSALAIAVRVAEVLGQQGAAARV